MFVLKMTVIENIINKDKISTLVASQYAITVTKFLIYEVTVRITILLQCLLINHSDLKIWYQKYH